VVVVVSHCLEFQGVWGGGGRGDEHCDLPVWELFVSAGLGRLMDGGGWSAGAASSGGEFQTACRGFVLIFVLYGLYVFFKMICLCK